METCVEPHYCFIQPKHPFGPTEINRLLLLAHRLGGRQVAFQPYVGDRRTIDRNIHRALLEHFEERHRVTLCTQVMGYRRHLLRNMYGLSAQSCPLIAETAFRLQKGLDNVAVYAEGATDFLSATIFHERTCVLKISPEPESAIREFGFQYTREPRNSF